MSDTDAQERACGKSARVAIGCIMWSSIAKEADFTVATTGSANTSKPVAYARFVAWPEDWAVSHDTHMMIFYDGQQGLDHLEAQPNSDTAARLVGNRTPRRHPVPRSSTEAWTSDAGGSSRM